MISFIVKLNNLKGLMEPLLKSEALVSHVQTNFRRSLFIKHELFSRRICKKEVYEQQFRNSENHKNLGKVIELSEDFDDVKIKEIKKGKRGKNTLYENIETYANVERNEDITLSKVQKHKNNLMESHKHRGKKFKVHAFGENVALFSSIMIQLKSKKNREKNKEIILEGKRLIREAISAGCKPKKIFFCRKEDFSKLQMPEGIKAYKVPYKNISLWSDVSTSQGIIGIFEVPNSITLENNTTYHLPLTVICDNVRDPGNLGSMLRVIAGAGCEKIILTKGCADVWEPKVLRAGCGAHFQLPIISNVQWSNVEREIPEHSKILVADISNSNIESCESKGKTGANLSVFRRKNEFSENLPSYCYHSLKYGDESTVIIIGGETHGISDEAYKFALDRKGSKIFIPMNYQIESLNNSVAMGIIAYEFRRQFELINRTGYHLSATNYGS